MKRILSFFLVYILFFCISESFAADAIRGVYGAPAGFPDNSAFGQGAPAGSAGVNSVFVSPKKETVSWYKEQGFKVFISVNVFGGKGAWEKYPDSRPVKANGKKLGEDRGDKGQAGVCPTHEKWRDDRMRHIRYLADVLGKGGGIDGIWLDYIRYPGFWETPKPDIPDTCYCPRCFAKFQYDRNIVIPTGIKTAEAALWIKANCSNEWMDWKKEQIDSFVREVKDLLSGRSGKIMLGIFAVPWRKGEKDNAISYLLAQDAFRLSRIADVISPMLYHRMCGHDTDWIAKMTGYFTETAECSVLPIIQSHDIGPDEFMKAAQNCGKAGADGILIFSYAGIRDSKFEKRKMWEAVKGFEHQENLLINPDFDKPEGGIMPYGWRTGETAPDSVSKSRFIVKKSEDIDVKERRRNFSSIGITSGYGPDVAWRGSIKTDKCEDGGEYEFSGLFYRDNWKNGVYPSVTFFGKRHYLDNHWKTKSFQPIRVFGKYEKMKGFDSILFENDNSGETFFLGAPKLTKRHDFPIKSNKQNQFYQNFFPIGVYGADADNLSEIKKLALNTVIIGGEGEHLKKTVEKCHETGLRYVISVPRDPDRLKAYLDYLIQEREGTDGFGDKYYSNILRLYDTAFYVNDEPELTSFPRNTASDIYELIKNRTPDAPVCMAMIRPRNCFDYIDASDFFMMDQYPVPNMPVTWLSDSIDIAASITGKERIVSVIQAFGGGEFENSGWQRMPTWREMDCLSFLSVVHGSRGIFFYAFSEIGKTEKGKEDLGRVVGRLNRVYPWLLEKNADVEVPVEMTSINRLDPSGRPAVHSCVKTKDGELMIMAVNSIGTHVEAKIGITGSCGDGKNSFFTEIFSGIQYPVTDGRISVKFGPYETKIFVTNY
jgi:hypothetical protein